MTAVAYLGPAGTFTEQAARDLAAPGDELRPMSRVPDVVQAVESGEVDAAVVAFENSLEGSIPGNLDQILLETDRCLIAGERVLPVSFVLFRWPDDASPLHRAMGLVRRANPPDAFFLRAEGHLRMLEEIAKNPPSGPTYGPDELHHLSHGESVWAVVTHRFSDGLYLLDEPEAGLSPMRQMALLAQIHELAKSGAQFIIATHSPILLAIPGATIFELGEDGIEVPAWRDCGAVADMREFLEAPEETVEYLISPETDED